MKRDLRLAVSKNEISAITKPKFQPGSMSQNPRLFACPIIYQTENRLTTSWFILVVVSGNRVGHENQAVSHRIPHSVTLGQS